MPYNCLHGREHWPLTSDREPWHLVQSLLVLHVSQYLEGGGKGLGERCWFKVGVFVFFFQAGGCALTGST